MALLVLKIESEKTQILSVQVLCLLQSWAAAFSSSPGCGALLEQVICLPCWLVGPFVCWLVRWLNHGTSGVVFPLVFFNTFGNLPRISMAGFEPRSIWSRFPASLRAGVPPSHEAKVNLAIILLILFILNSITIFIIRLLQLSPGFSL